MSFTVKCDKCGSERGLEDDFMPITKKQKISMWEDRLERVIITCQCGNRIESFC